MLLGITAVCLIVYWILMRFVPTPGLGHPGIDFPILDPDKNLSARGWIATSWPSCSAPSTPAISMRRTRDPEGVLSTIPSFGTAFLGCCTAPGVDAPPEGDAGEEPAIYLLGMGVVSIFLGELWNPYLPINKKVWTSSYVLFCAGIAMILLSLLSTLVDTPRWPQRHRVLHTAAKPWLIFGSNAIFAYVIADVWEMIFNFFHFPDPTRPGRTMGLFRWGYLHTVAAHGSTPNTSLVYSLAFVALCFFSTWLLWRNKIFLKV